MWKLDLASDITNQWQHEDYDQNNYERSECHVNQLITNKTNSFVTSFKFCSLSIWIRAHGKGGIMGARIPPLNLKNNNRLYINFYKTYNKL